MAMDDDELEAIRRKKLAELQQIQGQAAAEQQYRDQVQAQRQTILRQILTPEARERLGRIELAYPELKENIENQLIQLAQSGRVQRQIDDPTLRQILERVIPKRPDEGGQIESACARVGHPADEAELHPPSEETVVAPQQAEGVRPWPSRRKNESWWCPFVRRGPPAARIERRGPSRRSAST